MGRGNSKLFAFGVMATLVFASAFLYRERDVLAGVILGTSQSVNLNTGLVAYWPFNGGDIDWTTNTAYDRSGQGNNGTLANMSTTTSPVMGKIGQALVFDGTNDYISTPLNDPGQNNNITVSAWIKMTNAAGAGQSIIRDRATGAFGTVAGIYLDICGNAAGTCSGAGTGSMGRVTFEAEDASTHYGQVTSSQTVNDGKWHHVVATWSQGSEAKIYIDGVSDTVNVINSFADITGPCSSVNPVEIGATPGVSTRNFNGTIDEVRIYNNRALSATEVKALYNSGISQLNHTQSTISDGLVGWWTFDAPDTDWTTNTTLDKSGQGNTGTMTNMSTTTSPTIGKVGQGLKFSASNQSINAGSAASLDNLGPMTVSAWVKIRSIGGEGWIIGKAADGVPDNGWFLGVGNQMGCTANSYEFFGSFFNQRHAANADLKLNQWQHVVVTWSGSTVQAPTIYVNGVASTQCSNTGGSRPDDSAQNLTIGNEPGGTQAFDGTIDDVRIYNRILSASEINTLYNAGKVTVGDAPSVTGNGLVGEWSFNAPDINWTTNKALDRSGNGYDASLMNMSTTSTPTIGRIGQALKFDGVSSYAITPSFTMDPTGGRSFSAWIKLTATGSNDIFLSQDGTQLEYYSPTGQLRIAWTGGAAYHYSSLSISPNQWYHVVGVETGGNNYKIYINGIKYLDENDGFTHSGAGTGSLYIGSNSFQSSLFPGVIDDVRVYNKSLSQSEITALYDQGR